MNCGERENLVPFLDGELSEPEERRVKEHLETCPECRRRALLLRRSYAALDSLEAPEPPAGISREVRKRARRRSLPALAAAAAVVLVAAFITLHTFTEHFRPAQPPETPAVATADLSPEERAVVEDLELFENYEIVSNFDLLADFETVSTLEEFPEVESL